MWNVRSRSSPVPIGEATATNAEVSPAKKLAARQAGIGLPDAERRQAPRP